MPISITTFLSYLLLTGSARALINATNCTDDTFSWAFNSLQQSPCLVTAYLAGACNNGSFDISALKPGNSYHGPSGSDNGDLCKCNTVVYSLVSACGACQQASWVTYNSWSFNCTTKASLGTFPKPVPSGTRVPKWAYDTSFVGGLDSWNVTAAEAIGDFPEVTGTAIFSPTLTASGSGSSSTSTSHSSSNHSGIEGGVIGGILGATLISGIVTWFVIRRRRARWASSTADTKGEIEQSITDPLTIETPRLYDPLDPTTYPKTEFQPQRFGSANHLQPSQLGYSGLPEV